MDLKDKQRDLQNKINEIRKKANNKKIEPAPQKGRNLIFDVIIEMLATIISSTCVGMLLDHFFGTSPIIVLISIFLGFLAFFKILWEKHFRK